MRMLKKLVIVAVVVPCLYGWVVLLEAHGAHQQESGSAHGGQHPMQDSSCTPTPSPSPGG